MRFPAACAALLIASGIIVAHALPSICGLLIVAGLPISVGLWLWGRALLRRHIVGLSALTFLASVSIALLSGSALYYKSALSPGVNHLNRWSRADVPLILTVTGRLRSKVRSVSGRVSYEIDVRSMVFERRSRKVTGRILIQNWGNGNALDFDVVHPGDVIRIAGTLSGLSGPRNPFDFDAETFHRRNGISAGFAPHASEKVHVEHRHRGWIYGIGRLRQAIRRRIELFHASASGREILPALLVGDRSLISAESNKVFRASGLAHLLAISGLHVGIVGFSLFGLMQVFLSRLRVPFRHALTIRCAATFIILFGYAILCGGSSSVNRAVTMAGVILLGKALCRNVQGWNALGVAAAVAMVLSPEDLFSAGFQLSFSAVAGIFIFNKTVWQRFARRPGGRGPDWMGRSVVLKRLMESVFISFSVTCGTLPVMLYHFGSAALGGLAANVFAIPTTSLLLVSGIFSTSFGAVPFVGSLLTASTDLLSSALYATAWKADFFFRAWSVNSGLWKLSLWGFFPLLLVLGLAGLPRSRFWKISVFIAVVLLLPRNQSGLLRIDVLDVGQGDAILITTPSRRTILVDAGWGSSSASAIERHLTGLGIAGIDLLVISHFHQDHAGGIPHLLSRIPISRISFPSDQRDSFRQIQSNSVGLGQNVIPRPVNRGDTLLVDEKLRIYVLAPTDFEKLNSFNDSGYSISSGVQESMNDRSLVLKIVYGETSFLLTGDAESAMESGLIKDFGNLLSSDGIKLAHHGSATSSSLPFLLRAAKTGGFAAISVGEKNRFGHPSPDVIARWLSYGIAVNTTSRNGAITYLSDGKELKLAERPD